LLHGLAASRVLGNRIVGVIASILDHHVSLVHQLAQSAADILRGRELAVVIAPLPALSAPFFMTMKRMRSI
jgi:hypothetical protein